MPNTPRMFPAQPPPPGWGAPQQPQPPQQGWRPPGLPAGWPPPGQLRKSRSKWIALVVCATLGVGALLTVPGYCTRREVRGYRAEIARRADMLKRWKAILNAGTCYRRDDGVRWYDAIDQTLAGKGNLLHDLTSHMPLIDKQCVPLLKTLEADPDLPDKAHDVVREWIAAEKPLTKLDDGQPDEVKSLLEARDKVRARVRTEVLPAVRDKIRKVQETHLAKKDYIWWRLELGLQLENVFDLGYATHRAGKDIVPVISVPLHTMVEQMDSADKEVGVHVMPSLGVLANTTSKNGWEMLMNLDDNGAWTSIEEDNSVFGRMPDEPQGCEINILDTSSNSNLR